MTGNARTSLDRAVKPGSGGVGWLGPPLRSIAISTSLDRPRILVVCTANQCRSPMAEALLRDLLARRRVPATVGSAGLMEGGAPATSAAQAVLGDQGLDLVAHRSRQLGDPVVDLAGSDLVLTMERRHLQEAMARVPAIRPRAFTLVDAVRRAEAAPPRRPDEDLRQWAERLAAGRTSADILGVGDDAVADPIGQPRSSYEAIAAQLRDLLTRLADRAWPSAGDAELRGGAA